MSFGVARVGCLWIGAMFWKINGGRYVPSCQLFVLFLMVSFTCSILLAAIAPDRSNHYGIYQAFLLYVSSHIVSCLRVMPLCSDHTPLTILAQDAGSVFHLPLFLSHRGCGKDDGRNAGADTRNAVATLHRCPPGGAGALNLQPPIK